jgi:hypothetical protein
MNSGRGISTIRIGNQEIAVDLGAADQRVSDASKGYADELNASGIPTTANIPESFVRQALIQAGNDPEKARVIIMEEARRRAGAKGEELDRSSAERRAAAMAAQRSQTAPGTEEYRDALEFNRGRQAAKDQLAQTGARGRANASTDIRATLDRIAKAPNDPRVYAAAIYGLARANEGPGARFTNQDFNISGGVMDLFTEIRMLGEQKFRGQIDQQRMRDIQQTLQDQLELVEASAQQDYETISGELEYQPTEATGDGYASELRSAYGRLPFFKSVGNLGFRPGGAPRGNQVIVDEAGPGNTGAEPSPRSPGRPKNQVITDDDFELLRQLGVPGYGDE